MLVGGIRTGVLKPQAETVKIGSISVNVDAGYKQGLFHLVDEGTPKDRALEYRDDLLKAKEG